MARATSEGGQAASISWMFWRRPHLEVMQLVRVHPHREPTQISYV